MMRSHPIFVVLPPLNGGLHCGDIREDIARRVHGCSRLSTAGSIAAGGPEGARPESERCSRLSTAGSIAATLSTGC